MNIYQSNTYRNNLSWLHFDDEPRVQERQQVKELSKTIKNLYNVIKLWRMRKLTLECKITIFKSFAISKIVHLVIITKVPNTVIEELKQIQKTFYGITKKLK